jgi:hypothetical protein
MIATAGDGTVWEVGVLDAQQSVALRQVADVRGSEVTRITVSEETAVLGTLGGVVARFRWVRSLSDSRNEGRLL